MERLLDRGEKLASAAQARAIQRVGSAMGAAGLAVTSASDGIVVRGRGLVKRWLVDPSLRFVASVPK